MHLRGSESLLRAALTTQSCGPGLGDWLYDSGCQGVVLIDWFYDSGCRGAS